LEHRFATIISSLDVLTNRVQVLEKRLEGYKDCTTDHELNSIRDDIVTLKNDIEDQLDRLQEELDQIEKSL